eukprot:CAMPEP_0119137764 /NCGR_PEP_ID=MMETSP1310-20130426/24301_1 /TAXON_ID=464262 /ORGANISM="Genus nov. species nov., Strain RCC2339" /LENGTH=251 /DNA_ID=CAMNT_0007128879 /DNA_START=318 /DNA_END=1074 /DNA_ORIENTATION=+
MAGERDTRGDGEHRTSPPQVTGDASGASGGGHDGGCSGAEENGGWVDGLCCENRGGGGLPGVLEAVLATAGACADGSYDPVLAGGGAQSPAGHAASVFYEHAGGRVAGGGRHAGRDAPPSCHHRSRYGTGRIGGQTTADAAGGAVHGAVAQLRYDCHPEDYDVQLVRTRPQAAVAATPVARAGLLVLVATVTHPLLVVQDRMACAQGGRAEMGPLRMTRTILDTEGPFALIAGLRASIAGVLLSSLVRELF